MGTPFIATNESAAGTAYKEAVVRASMDDIEVRSDLTGIPASIIKSADKSGRDRRAEVPYDVAVIERGAVAVGEASLFSAGHSAGGVSAIRAVAELVAGVEHELIKAYQELPARVSGWPARS
jgi:nitronate monooxygenase